MLILKYNFSLEQFVENYQNSTDVERIKHLSLILKDLEIRSSNYASFQRAGILRKQAPIPKVNNGYALDYIRYTVYVDKSEATTLNDFLGDDEIPESKKPRKSTTVKLETIEQRERRLSKKKK